MHYLPVMAVAKMILVCVATFVLLRIGATFSSFRQSAYDMLYSPGRIFPAILMQQILFSNYYISITLMVSLWANMAGELVPGLYMYRDS